jgi:nitrate/nitrite transport system permease protein
MTAYASALLRSASLLDRLGLGWLSPLLRMAGGADRQTELRRLGETAGAPLLALLAFLALWQLGASNVQTSLGALPGPLQVAREFAALGKEHAAERAKAAAFHARQVERDAAQAKEDPDYVPVPRRYTGRATFFDQIATSLKTVFAGFTLATLVAVPLGLLCGSSVLVQSALNPLIQVFKPVSPLAWLPIVTLVVSSLYTASADWLPTSFVVSAITVMLCSLWPTVINTAVGVASVDRDLLNVARVLRLPWWTRMRSIVLPSAMPLIFTGMRLSVGVGWMVLIAAEMLAQNPGLGKFVWDEFQNGSSQSLARIMVAVLTIGLIGFVLDRAMLTLQELTSRGDRRA